MAEITLPKRIRKLLKRKLEDREAKVSAQRTSLGWIKLQVVTSEFQDKPLVDREQHIDSLLADLNMDLGQYPFVDYDLLTPEEAKENPYKPIQLPLWSEVLMAPHSEPPTQGEEESLPRPHIVTFYSFKGGVGRTTALSIVAGLLANRGRRVVVVDFDLEAPGLSYLFPIDSSTTNGEQLGVLDYLYQRTITPDKNTPTIEDCMRQVNFKTRGEVYLIPAGEYDEGYIHRLADLSVRSLYQREDNPVHQLIEDITTQLEPEAILIDARTGFDDTGAIALLDLAHTAVVCFSPTDQSFNGLKWVVQAANKQQQQQGSPDLRFLLTPIPPFASDQRQELIGRAEDWIEENWGLQPDTPVKELYYTISYNAEVAALSDSVTRVPRGILDSYEPIAEVIDASIPNDRNTPKFTVPENWGSVLGELQFQAATAWDLEADNISNIFQRTDDFPKFLNERIQLIRGAKGTGKSLLFRLFVEQAEAARELASPYTDLSQVQFVPGHGPSRLRNWPFLHAKELSSSYHEGQFDEFWSLFWINYALLQLCRSQPDLIGNTTSLDSELIRLSKSQPLRNQEVVSWLSKRAKESTSYSKSIDELNFIDTLLGEHQKRVWLLYDELDASFVADSQNQHIHEHPLNALFAFWLERGSALKNITPKILLRQDIWQDLNFTNKGHYASRDLELRWEEADLWRLVLRQVLNSSEAFKQFLDSEYGLTLDRLEKNDEGQLRRSLYPLWGERMGAKKAYTHNWVRTRITDSQNNSFPRSLILLLEEAIEKEKVYSSENISEALIRPRALIEALPSVSEQRVDEVRDEYPEFGEYLDKLQDRRSPIEQSQLAEVWGKEGEGLESLIKDMIEAGILEQRASAGDSGDPRYAVAELYLHGLGMVRKGQR